MNKRNTRRIGLCALIASAALIGLAAVCTIKNAIVVVSSPEVMTYEEVNRFILHHPSGPTPVQVETREGWAFEGGNEIQTVVHNICGTNVIKVVGRDGEQEAEITILDDWEHIHEPSNYVKHVSPPSMKASSVPGPYVLMYALPKEGAYLPAGDNPSWETDKQGTHNEMAKPLPCPVPICDYGKRNESKTNNVVMIDIDGATIKNSREPAPNKKLSVGVHPVTYTGTWSSTNCVEKKCISSASTNTTVEVFALALECEPYIGLDMTDEGKTGNTSIIREGKVTLSGKPDPKEYNVTVDWGTQNLCELTPSGDQLKINYSPRLSTAWSGNYRDQDLSAKVTVTRRDNNLKAEATATNHFTVVRVDVKIGIPEKDDDSANEKIEETVGAYLYHIPEGTNGLWTSEATNQLRKVEFLIYPKTLPEDQTVSISADTSLLFELKDGEYKPAAETYSLKELKERTFWLHGHRKSQKYLGETIQITHELSGALDIAKFTIFGRPLLVPDYDRKNSIDKEDVRLAKEGEKVFRFWINDDDDVHMQLSSIDGSIEDMRLHKSMEKGGNCTDDHINGYSDIVDLTPLWIDLSNVFPEGSDHLKPMVEWIVESDCYKGVWTLLTRDAAKLFRSTQISTCGPQFKQELQDATTCVLEGKTGILPETLSKLMMASSGDGNSNGVLLLEGSQEGSKLEILGRFKESQHPICRGSLKTKVSPVTDMIRWMNLRGITSDEKDTGRKSDYEDEPKNRPDGECMQYDDRHFIFIHGYNINKDEALGWSCEVFKRLWQSGYRGRFTGVDWYGDKSQFNLGVTTFAPNYWGNVTHAFCTAAGLKAGCDKLEGRKNLVAHSLGNILMCSAVIDEHLTNGVDRCYMLNAAVPIQAFSSEPHKSGVMIDEDWTKTDDEFFSANWFHLFQPPDFRSKLNWIARFKGIKKGISLYSETENVLRDTAPRPVWKWQELWKGNLASKLFDCEVGWSQNSFHSSIWEDLWNSDSTSLSLRAGRLTEEQKTTEPLFKKFVTRGRELHSLEKYCFPKAQNLEEKRLRAQILGHAIPATSLCAGANKMPMDTGVKSYEYSLFKSPTNGWPRGDGSWCHSDFVVVAYYYIYKLFDALQEGLL